ncbi:hypothetical protein B0H10DRAFT_1998980 [Mycena sp. CBHHK59/15]|nr:hypothetical protein B0H10DRAFT_2119070 [Mycena sp. CBHHK59/15]KAJ6563551.1 hypothetical protein B0H10DRAFT_2115033 [Mycena sp. CBHHK59/15]KAJ6626349.1 hypothetical protein B0H10DRAFT_1998980 [Mycena sp. CBHHK59/15]
MTPFRIYFTFQSSLLLSLHDGWKAKLEHHYCTRQQPHFTSNDDNRYSARHCSKHRTEEVSFPRALGW